MSLPEHEETSLLGYAGEYWDGTYDADEFSRGILMTSAANRIRTSSTRTTAGTATILKAYMVWMARRTSCMPVGKAKARAEDSSAKAKVAITLAKAFTAVERRWQGQRTSWCYRVCPKEKREE